MAVTWGNVFKMGATLTPALSAAANLYQGYAVNKSAKQQATLAREEAASAARTRETEIRQLVANQKTAYTAAGIALEGSPELLIAETESLGAQEVADIRNLGEARARNLREQGRNALIGSGLSAAASLTGGIFDYGRADKKGLFDDATPVWEW